MGLWERLEGPRNILRKVKFIYEPYRKVKVAYVVKKRWKALHKNGAEVIDIVEKALTAYGVTYFADYGTLLGIVRDHDFIQWDSDMDYGLIVNNDFDWKRFENHMKQYRFKKIREFSFMGKITEQTYENRNVCVDFFKKTIEGERLVSYIYFHKEGYEYLSKHDFHVRKMKYAFVNKIKRIQFKKTYVNIPANEEQYLESVYSGNWRIPDPNSDGNKYNIELEELEVLEVLEVLGKGVCIK